MAHSHTHVHPRCQVLRLFRKNVLYYRVSQGKPIQDVLDLFVQVRARTKPPAPLGLVEINEEDEEGIEKTAADATTEDTEPVAGTGEADLFALHLLTRRLICQPKAPINARVVVVGASTCALSFLESLLLTSDLNYSNLTLLSGTGLPRGCATDDVIRARTLPLPAGLWGGLAVLTVSVLLPRFPPQAVQFQPWDLSYDNKQLTQLCIASRVRVQSSRLEDIDCEERKITLADGTVVPYDFLVVPLSSQFCYAQSTAHTENSHPLAIQQIRS